MVSSPAFPAFPSFARRGGILDGGEVLLRTERGFEEQELKQGWKESIILSEGKNVGFVNFNYVQTLFMIVCTTFHQVLPHNESKKPSRVSTAVSRKRCRLPRSGPENRAVRCELNKVSMYMTR